MTAVLTASLSVGSASAEAAALPQAQDLVGVGAQTTQSLLSQLSVDYNASLGSDTASPRLYSWDATGTSPVITKTGATSIPRPDGAGAGIKALVANTSATVDFVRSDRGPTASDPHGLDFVALVKDAVTWSAQKTGNAPAQLTPAQLNGIYACSLTNWQQIDPGLPNATIRPYLPQGDSGTRASFLSAIALTVPGACVIAGPEENQGTDPALNDPNAVFPYSVGHYLGQTAFGHTTSTDAPGNLTLRNIAFGNYKLVPVTDSVIDQNFANSQFGHLVYGVFRDAEWTGADAHAQALQNVFGVYGWICNDPVAQADIATFGFLALPSCGVTITLT
ncbi:PstS family phosphate ABC transporter substrate-binding protein [Kitasatospora sp. NPDC094011]|uniref:PstS family phosphate ABC transporter substrate-binding protein n=1 Tax=Kitasatospora sp. NPDC094011 TaxID=3364090 RepID=UPI003810FAD9